MDWLNPTFQGILVVGGFALACVAGLLLWAVWRYLGVLARIFEEKPLFVVPRGEPLPGAEDVHFPTRDGLTLRGSYLHTTAPRRRGVVLFGPEFGSNRWSISAYCTHLLADGYDLFTFDFRCHGDSDRHPLYVPLMWVTNHEERDLKAAVAYLQGRPDADPNGIGIFGVSRGAGAAILAAAKMPYVRCIVTDGAFSTRTTMIPYMRKWVDLYCTRLRMQRWLPDWFFGMIAHVCLWFLARRRHCKFPSLKHAVAKLAPRPLLMIHGSQDTYIKAAMAERLFAAAGEPKELWLVPKAKHNQAHCVAREEYRRRITAFFDQHLAAESVPAPTFSREPLPSADNAAAATTVAARA